MNTRLGFCLMVGVGGGEVKGARDGGDELFRMEMGSFSSAKRSA